MATIKLQAGKVLTVAGRVQCECCDDSGSPQDCCYYSAESFGVEYLREDLPETFTIRQAGTNAVMPMTLTSSGQNIYEGTDPSTGRLSRIRHTPFAWELEIINPIGSNWSGVQDWAPQECLLWSYAGTDVWPLPPPDPGASTFTYPDDDFEDTYVVEAYTLPLDGPIESEPIAYTLQIVRKALCEWGPVGEEFPNLLYNGTSQGSPDRTQLWTFDYYFRIDGGPYNSPEGQYGSPSNIFLVRKP